MKQLGYTSILLLGLAYYSCASRTQPVQVPPAAMEEIYQEIKTPHKYGLVKVPVDDSEKMDCPSIFRAGEKWYMTYLVFDGRGYETLLAESTDLLHWNDLGKLLSFSDSNQWDGNQKAGYIALQDHTWGGSYALNRFDNKYWMSYFGGSSRGYEQGDLSIGIAYTSHNPATAHEWTRLAEPVLTSRDPDVRWWDNRKIFKSSVIWDETKTTGYPF